MYTRFVSILTAVVAFSCCTSLVAQEPADMAAPAPGPEHELLKGRVGEWTCSSKIRMAEDAPWSPENLGTETVSMGCGGFWQFAKIEMTFMGMPYEGRSTLGYDQLKKKYVGTWVDNFGSWLTLMEGDYDAKSKTLTMHADMIDPGTGKPMKTRFITEIKDADNCMFKLIMPGADGKDFTHMEMTYKRKK